MMKSFICFSFFVNDHEKLAEIRISLFKYLYLCSLAFCWCCCYCWTAEVCLLFGIDYWDKMLGWLFWIAFVVVSCSLKIIGNRRLLMLELEVIDGDWFVKWEMVMIFYFFNGCVSTQDQTKENSWNFLCSENFRKFFYFDIWNKGLNLSTLLFKNECVSF